MACYPGRGGAQRAANIIRVMRRRLPKARSLLGVAVLGLAAAALLGGCGGSTKTVSIASAPPVQTTGTTTTPTTRTSPATKTPATTTPTSTTPPASTPSGGTSSPSTTRTAPAPAFTHQSTTAETEGLSGAEAVLKARGFTATTTSDYHPSQTLRVLIGTRTGSSEGNGQQAFFFVGGRYIGTDAKQPSASIHVVSQGETEVTLAYTLSSGGQATVPFQLNNGKLVPLDPIPSASSRQ